MKKFLVMLLAVVTALSMSIPAFAAEEAASEEAAEKNSYPVVGSWTLDEVYEMKDGADVSLLKKEENQSLYGAGVSVLTFDEDGVGHEITIDGEDTADLAAEWKSTSPGAYNFKNESGMELTFRYDEKTDTLHRSLEEETRKLDFVYARGFIGSWKLDKVMQINEGDAPTELTRENAQSVYGSGETVFTFDKDGKGKDVVTDGADKAEIEGTWEMKETDQIVFTEKEGLELTFDYFRVDDTLLRDVKDDAPDAAYPHLRFVYVRTEEEKPAEEKESQPATQPQSETKPAETKPNGDDELIAGGQIFTGIEQVLYDPDTGEAVLVKELNQGGWANDQTGVIYYQEEGGGDHYYGDDGSVLVSEWYYNEYIAGSEPDGDDELIAGGQIFTGADQILWDPETGSNVFVQELNQGGWANDETGVIYYQEEGGGDHYYGDDGSVLVSEWYYFEYIHNAGNDDDDDYDYDDGDDELIAGGQIFTGETMDLYDPEGGGVLITVSELNQGGWADQETGIIYYEDSDNDGIYHGDDGSLWVTGWYLESMDTGSNGLDDDDYYDDDDDDYGFDYNEDYDD